MDTGALLGNSPRYTNKGLLLGITIVNRFVSTDLKNAARQAEKHLTNAVKQNNKYWVSFPASYSLLPLAMLVCSELHPDVHTLIKKLVKTRMVEMNNSSEFLVEE